MLEGLLFRTQKLRGSKLAEGVPRQGNVVLRQCGNSTQDAVLDVHDTVICEVKEKIRAIHVSLAHHQLAMQVCYLLDLRCRYAAQRNRREQKKLI